MSTRIGGDPLILPPGNFNYLKLTRINSGQISIGVGECRDSTDSVNVINPSPLTVDISTSGAGGLDTGSEAANTLYTCYIISGSSGVAGILSTNQTTPTLPAGYQYFRRVGAVRNNSSSNILNFTQEGNANNRRMVYLTNETTLRVLTNGSATSYTAVSLSAFMPVTSTAPILAFNYEADDKNDFATLRPTGSSLTDLGFKIHLQGDKNREGYGVIEPITNAAQSLDYQVEDNDDELDLSVIGYHDNL
jgi:hypothetical protein